MDFSGPSLHKLKDAIEPLHLFYRYKGNENLHHLFSTFNFFAIPIIAMLSNEPSTHNTVRTIVVEILEIFNTIIIDLNNNSCICPIVTCVFFSRLLLFFFCFLTIRSRNLFHCSRGHRSFEFRRLDYNKHAIRMRWLDRSWRLMNVSAENEYGR